MTPVGRAMAVTLGVAALAFSLAACSSDGWLIKSNGADDVSTIGLFTECTDGDNCCSLIYGRAWCKKFGETDTACLQYHKLQIARAFGVLSIITYAVFLLLVFAKAHPWLGVATQFFAAGSALIAFATFTRIRLTLTTYDTDATESYRYGRGWALITASWIVGFFSLIIAFTNRKH